MEVGIKIQLAQDEEILAKRRARMYKGGKWSGWRGRLALTGRRLWFEADVFGLLGTQEEILIDEIADVRLKNTLGFMPNCLWVRKKSGETYEFIVSGRRQLLEIIESRLSPV